MAIVATINQTAVFDTVEDARVAVSGVSKLLSGGAGFGGVTLRDASTGRPVATKLPNVDRSLFTVGGQEVNGVAGKYVRIATRLRPELADILNASDAEAFATVSVNDDGSRRITFDNVAFFNYLSSLNVSMSDSDDSGKELAAFVVEVAGAYASAEAQASLQLVINKARKAR